MSIFNKKNLEKAMDYANKAGDYVLNQAEENQKNIEARAERMLQQKLRQYNDDQIEKAYRDRYNNSNLSEMQIKALEKEARRRGIY